jgi:hypothetical protein
MAEHVVAQRFMADGPSQERSLLRRAMLAKVAELVKLNPSPDYSTVRRLCDKARAGKLDREVFKEFVRRTDSISLVEEIFITDKYQREVKWGVKL